MAIKKGDQVSVDYEGSFDDGTVFDSSTHGDHKHPLEFTVGAGEVIIGFENGVIGLNKGDEKTITIKPEEAYGEYNDMMKQKVPRSALPKDQEPKPGMTLLVGAPDGRQIPVKISDVDAESITVDMNHPLAGKTLHFKIKVVDIKQS